MTREHAKFRAGVRRVMALASDRHIPDSELLMMLADDYDDFISLQRYLESCERRLLRLAGRIPGLRIEKPGMLGIIAAMEQCLSAERPASDEELATAFAVLSSLILKTKAKIGRRRSSRR
ncbi:MAG TPA: hypothetical protein VM008_17370 [Phycisphaerae bacterium]|nr:hypothetical protein [Phycisphaerae bacterium]